MNGLKFPGKERRYCPTVKPRLLEYGIAGLLLLMTLFSRSHHTRSFNIGGFCPQSMASNSPGHWRFCRGVCCFPKINDLFSSFNDLSCFHIRKMEIVKVLKNGSIKEHQKVGIPYPNVHFSGSIQSGKQQWREPAGRPSICCDCIFQLVWKSLDNPLE